MEQREIKFRLRRDNIIVGYEKWDGSFDDWSYSVDGECCWTRRPIGHNEKDQCTGLEDRNGKEICEGDIVNTTGYDNQQIVEYREIEASDDMTAPGIGFQFNSFPGEMKIIGNIYENKELLKN